VRDLLDITSRLLVGEDFSSLRSLEMTIGINKKKPCDFSQGFNIQKASGFMPPAQQLTF